MTTASGRAQVSLLLPPSHILSERGPALAGAIVIWVSVSGSRRLRVGELFYCLAFGEAREN